MDSDSGDIYHHHQHLHLPLFDFNCGKVKPVLVFVNFFYYVISTLRICSQIKLFKALMCVCQARRGGGEGQGRRHVE